MPILNVQNLDKSVLAEFDLVYVEHESLTIKRVKKGKGYSFQDQNGKTVSDNNILDRLQSLAIPPTYTDALCCTVENGHLQAVGIDSTGNKQYFYHASWEKLREITKFTALHDFGDKIPAFRRKISKLLNADNDRNRVLAAMFRILDETGMRVGGESSAKENKTYGITTLRKKHIDVVHGDIDFDYKAKGGVEVSLEIHDQRLADILEQCEEISGQRLFEYQDDDGKKQQIRSHHMNEFLKQSMGDQYSVKDFRTWRFSCLFLKFLLKALDGDAKITLKFLLDQTAEKTGNTPSILQSSYIHPGLIDIAKNPQTHGMFLKTDEKLKGGLRHNEAIFLNYLQSDHAKNTLMA